MDEGVFHLKGHRGLPDSCFSLDFFVTLFPLQNKGNPVYRSLLPAWGKGGNFLTGRFLASFGLIVFYAFSKCFECLGELTYYGTTQEGNNLQPFCGSQISRPKKIIMTTV